MSYQVLARKWRPRTFAEVAGQEHVLRALINSLDRDRLHHAYLFTGTRGVGKTTLARILAKCLNCEQGVSSVPCNQCSACREISEGRFVDLIEVDAASRTKVEDTRELLENVQYAPTRGRYKVYLIDEVHMLSSHSFNALLKTLEEPPPHMKFLLATTDPQKLPVTVLSRCLQFNLKNLSPERIVDYLRHILDEEKIPHEETALWALARAADGSMRDALSLADQAIAHGGGTLAANEVNAMLGTIDRSRVAAMCIAVAEGDVTGALAAVNHLAEHAADYQGAVAEMLSMWHQVAMAQAAPDALDPLEEHRPQVLELAEKLSREDVQLFYQITLLARRDLPLAADLRSGFEMLLLRLLAFNPQLPTQSELAPKRPVEGREVVAGVKKSELSSPGVTSKPSLEEADQCSPNAGFEQGEQKLPPVTPSTSPPMVPDASLPRVSAAPQTLDPPPRHPASHQSAAVDKKPDQGSASTELLEKVPFCELNAATWAQVCQGLGRGGVVHNSAVNAIFERVEGDRVCLALDESQSALYEASHQQRLAKVLGDYFSKPVEVSVRVCAIEGETPRMIAERLAAERLRETIETLRADTNVRDLCRVFDAELIESSVKPTST